MSTFTVHIDMPDGCSPYTAPEALRVLANSLTFDGIEAGSGWVRNEAGDVVGNWYVVATDRKDLVPAPPLVCEG